MKKYLIKLKWGLLIAFIGCLGFACSKMDSTYHKFIKDGELHYSKQPDSVQLFPGRNRVKIDITVSGPKIDMCRVFWNAGMDSVNIPMIEDGTVSVTIDNLEEGSETFAIYTIDSRGNKSIAIDTLIRVFGKRYENDLINRKVVEAELTIGGGAHISWEKETDSTAIATELHFKDQNDVTHTLLVPYDSMHTHLDVVPQGDSLQSRTVYLPTVNAIDSFYSPYQTVKFTKPELVYDNFPETFESDAGKKTTYSQANVQLTSGLWNFDYWLIGTAGADRKHGSVTSRSFNGKTSGGHSRTGILEMLFDLSHGASKISFYHAICSSDDPSTFKVQASTDGGATWFDVSKTLYNKTTTLEYVEIELDITQPVRFRFYHFSYDEAGGSQGRMNVDDISVSYFYGN